MTNTKFRDKDKIQDSKVIFHFNRTEYSAQSWLCCIQMVNGQTNACIPPRLNKQQQKKSRFIYHGCPVIPSPYNYNASDSSKSQARGVFAGCDYP